LKQLAFASVGGVDVTGMLQRRAKGLLLGGGNHIGRPGIHSAAAAVDANGDFTIAGAHVPVAPDLAAVPPNPCNLPILLIRNSTAATAPDGRQRHGTARHGTARQRSAHR
jgi:hypothetical protein